MGFVDYNANPFNNRTSDCVIRAISTLTEDSWDNVYIDLSLQGFLMKDVMLANNVWGKYLYGLGYRKSVCPCEDCCLTIKEFCKTFVVGRYLLCTGTHVVAAINGDYYDTSDSGDEVVEYYWKKEIDQW